jgi:hypothetical protein
MKEPRPSDVTERRSKVRYPIRLSVRYRGLGRMGGVVGVGQTLDLSSSGILVESPHQQEVSVGSRLEVGVEWPVMLDGTSPLQVVVRGRVVRSGMFRFAVSFQGYQFRTMKRPMGTLSRTQRPLTQIG